MPDILSKFMSLLLIRPQEAERRAYRPGERIDPLPATEATSKTDPVKRADPPWFGRVDVRRFDAASLIYIWSFPAKTRRVNHPA